jgi:hypothetical protein
MIASPDIWNDGFVAVHSVRAVRFRRVAMPIGWIIGEQIMAIAGSSRPRSGRYVRISSSAN